MSLLSRGADTFYAFRFLRLLTTPWEKTGAFNAGIIDKDGKVLRKAETSDDRNVYNIFHKLVFNVKRLLNKLPFGKTTIASYLTGLYLIREHTGMTDAEMRDVLSEWLNEDIGDFINESINETLEEGTYVLANAVPIPKLGDIHTTVGDSIVIDETSKCPKGYILGAPIYEVYHERTALKIFVTQNDLYL